MVAENKDVFDVLVGEPWQLEMLAHWVRLEIGKRRPWRTTWHGEIFRLVEELCDIACVDAHRAVEGPPTSKTVEARGEVCEQAWHDMFAEVVAQLTEIKEIADRRGGPVSGQGISVRCAR